MFRESMWKASRGKDKGELYTSTEQGQKCTVAGKGRRFWSLTPQNWGLAKICAILYSLWKEYGSAEIGRSISYLIPN